MSTATLTAGPINLDCATDDDLQEFVEQTSGRFPWDAAEQLFPTRMPNRGVVLAVQQLRRYAQNTLIARAARARGGTNVALLHEQICDRIYDQLPEWARW